MKPHEERVLLEKKELDDKREKLKLFIHSSPIFNELTEIDKDLLERQEVCMEEYSNILGDRISRFES